MAFIGYKRYQEALGLDIRLDTEHENIQIRHFANGNSQGDMLSVTGPVTMSKNVRCGN